MDGWLNDQTLASLAKQSGEPAWMADRRTRALAKHQSLPWPHSSDDIWRRTDVSLLDPSRGFTLGAQDLLQSLRMEDAQLAAWTQPLGGEHLIVRANGSWLSEPAIPGVMVQELAQAASKRQDALATALDTDSLSPAEQKLATLNDAFHHDDVVIDVPANTSVDRPIRFVRMVAAGANSAVFPSTVITVGAGSEVTLIDEYIGVGTGSGAAPHLVNSRIELVIEPDARVHYVRLQRWDSQAREFLLQRATLSRGATLTMANLNLGASLSKAHIITRLSGEHASSRIYGFVFGHAQQHVDQHTLQDHLAPHTTSDLQFRAALQDQSRMVYTGLIRIAAAAQQTNAYQSNHNLLLSRQAQAEAIPMLEILADDVQCKHGVSVGPIDEEQVFYLTSRAIPRLMAERLVVMGFIEPIVEQVPFEPLQEKLRAELEGELHYETIEPAALPAGV